MREFPKSQPPSRYSRLYSKMWTDEKFQHLKDLTKLLWAYLLSTEHRTLEGIFRCPLCYIASDLGWTVKQVASRMEVLQQQGFVSLDEKANLILLRNALRYQWPEGTNVILGVKRRLEALPKSPLLQEFLTLTQIHCGQLNSAPSAQAFAQALERAFGPPSQPASELLISESESEIENKKTLSQSRSQSRLNGKEAGEDFCLPQSEEERKENEIRKRYPHLSEVGR